MEREKAEKERKKEEEERRRKREEQQRKKRILEAAFDGDIEEINKILQEVRMCRCVHVHPGSLIITVATVNSRNPCIHVSKSTHST